MADAQQDAQAQTEHTVAGRRVRSLRASRRRLAVGRGWAYVGAYLGACASIAANVAHSFVPWPGAPEGWSPAGGAVVSAVFWPVALLVAVEIFARTDWPVGARWAALRWLGLVPVALVAAIVSYRHMSGLLTFYREDPVTVLIGPLAVDSLMVIATAALIGTSPVHRRAARPVDVPGAVEVVEPEVPDADPGPQPVDVSEPADPGNKRPVDVTKETSAKRKPFQPKPAEREAVFALYDSGTTEPALIVETLAKDGMTVALRTAQHWLAQRSNGHAPAAHR